ncbi:MAG: NAD(P)-dependent oxidoreductase [Candidatus Tectomicrobia bacterium]|nr:NAD(P)-dependent oxidoreductase [Candidatus Tectomicrobia bacterium]
MSEPILITGGAGSVGRLLVQRCREAGQPVRIFDLPVCDFSGLEGEAGIEVVKGDITDAATVEQAVHGVGAVMHLAALLPPASEAHRERTLAINVEGTSTILRAMETGAKDAVLVFSSSVSTYGDTRAEPPPVRVEHPQTALDIYAESKIASEGRIRESSVDAVILRIAGISVPVLQEPPEVWPFTAEQRLEMVHRDDVVTALYNALVTPEARGKTLNIGGGSTWQTTGSQYVEDHFELIGVPVEMAAFRGDHEPGWVDWYDSAEAQQLLAYQEHSYEMYLDTLRAEVAKMLEE